MNNKSKNLIYKWLITLGNFLKKWWRKNSLTNIKTISFKRFKVYYFINRSIIEGEQKYNPERIELEKLNVSVIFNEPDAEKNLNEFLIKRPYLRKYHDWEENRS